MTISIITPVRDGGVAFRRSLHSLLGTDPPAHEVIVVADGVTDGSDGWAEAAGARVVRLAEPDGPARARNAGARAATGDVLLFVDADVLVPRDLVGRVADVLAAEPTVAAVIGSYDDRPDDPGFLSQYRNLLHHFVHQRSKTEASTFWCGCGAVRRDVFLATGGFDEGYRDPAIEDIELGYRLRRSGHRILLRHDLQVTHLKRWSAWTLMRTDLLSRALPWARLSLRERTLPNDLNLTIVSRVSAVLAAALAAALGLAVFFPAALVAAAVAVVILIALNISFYRFLADRRGWPFAIAAVPWHWLYFAAGAAGFGIAMAEAACSLVWRGLGLSSRSTVVFPSGRGRGFRR